MPKIILAPSTDKCALVVLVNACEGIGFCKAKH